MTYENAFAALADPTRRQIFEHLRTGPLSVRELADVQVVSRPAVSQHLKVLRTAGLIDVKPVGTRRYYSVRHAGLADLRNYLDSFWTDVLETYADAAQQKFGAQDAGPDKKNS